MTITADIRAIAAKLRKATSSITDEIAKLRREIAEKRQALQHTQDAPPPLNEIAERIKAHVAEIGADWLATYGSSFIVGDRGPGAPPWNFAGSPPWGAICASDPEYAVSFLRGIVERVPYEAGPPSSARPGLIAKFEEEIYELGLAEENLVDESAEGGVHIEHRPEVLQRRESEAREQQRMERAVAARRERQEALDRRYAPEPGTVFINPSAPTASTPRIVNSQYLEANRPTSGRGIA